MSTIVTRSGKGSPLTHTEVDNNFTNLNTDKLQSGDTAASLTITSADINGGTIDGATIGASSASTGAFTTATASTSFGSPVFKATSSAGGALQNSSGTNQLQWGGGGGNNLSVDVAININPANAQVAISPTGTGSVTINPATAGTINNMSIGATTASTGAFTTLSASGVATVSAGTVSAPAITTSGDTNTGIFFPAADTIAFTEGGAEAMRIDSSGNLGVGTSSPNGRLEVNKAITFSNGDDFAQLVVKSASGATGKLLNIGVDETNNLSFIQSNNRGIDANSLVLQRYGGNVGIGTSSPQAKLDVNGNIHARGASFPAFKFADSSGNAEAEIYYGISSNDLNIVSNQSGGQIVFSANGSERMRVDSSGNLLVGSTSANGKLYVENSSVTNTAKFSDTNASTTSDGICIALAARNTTNNTFYALGYYNTGVGAYKFRVADSGNVTNTNNSYGAISDVKLKENIVDASPKLEDLCKVKIRQYNLKSDPDHKQIGVVAQELEEVFAGLVETTIDKDLEGNDLGTTTKQVKYSVFVPMLIKAIQEQQAIITDLKSRIESLESK